MRDNDNFNPIFFFILLIGAIVGATVLGADGCGANYSDGDRSGVIVKLSQKGFIWKSWEGEMRLGGDQNVTSGAWFFSVRDESLVVPLQESLKTGHRVNVHYTQWWHKPLAVDTQYEVQSVSNPDKKESK